MRALSEDLRRRIIDAWKKRKLNTQELAHTFGVSEATVRRFKRRWQATGSVGALPHGGGQPRKINPEQEKFVQGLVQQHPDWTEDMYADALLKKYGLKVSSVTAGRVIRRLGYSVKKKRSSPLKGIGKTSAEGASSISRASKGSPLRVWFLWTKRVRTSR
jgi:transposase